MRRFLAATAALAMIAASPAFAQTGAPQPAQQQFLPGIFGCTATGGKQEVGAVIGGVIGGVAGNKIMKKNKTLGTVLGAAVGVGLGSWIGCQMQKGDQERAQAAAEKAIASGQSTSWSNPETGASGNVSVQNISTGAPSMAGVKFAKGVSLQSNYTALSGRYVAANAANIRSSPSTKGKLMGKLAQGQEVDVLAGVTSGPWVLISQGGLATGYVAASLLRGADGGAVQTASSCRMVTEQVSASAGAAPQTTSYRACKTTEGTWELTAA